MEKEKGFAVWLTGIPASGKSTIASALSNELEKMSCHTVVLESDELRKILTPNPTYSEEEREHFYDVLVFIGELMVENGVNVIFDATANRRRYRDKARSKIERFYEVHVLCPAEVCMQRDPKGLYEQAKGGRISTLPGIQTGYESPKNPEITIYSDKETTEKAVEKIIKELL